MNLLAGTQKGVYRGPPGAFDEAVRVLDSDRVMRLRTFGPRTYAATRGGLYRSLDGGDSWTHIETPRPEVHAALEHPLKKRLYAGTHPAHLYVSTNAGETWTELEGLQALPSRSEWHTPRHGNEAHVRGLRAAGEDRLVASIEVGGIYVSDNGGETWRERRSGLRDDVHHVLVGEEQWFASTGDGLYRSDDEERSWRRLDRDLEGRYFRAAHRHDGRLFAAATVGPPPTWDGPRGTDAALYESRADGETLQPVEYAGGPGEFVLSWATADGEVYAGTTAGQLLRRTDEGWLGTGGVPSGIASLAAVK